MTERGSGPVTLIMRRAVRTGCEQDFESWLRRTADASAGFPGYQGTSVLRPPEHGREYVYIVRFDSYTHLRAWEDSPERAARLERLGGLVEGDSRRQVLTGLEPWFAPPGAPLSKPRQRAKMAVVTVLAIYPLSLLASATVEPALDPLPGLLRELLVVLLLVVLLTYVVMPMLTRLLAGWLMPGE